MLSRLSLRTLLTIPYVVLVLLLAVVVAALSYRAGQDAVDELSGRLLQETVHRIAQAVDRHVGDSSAVLEVAFPRGIAAPRSIEAELPALRTRFWLATDVHRDPNNYAYYGDREGRFFGLWRHSAEEAELRLRLAGEGPRTIARFAGIDGKLAPAEPEQRVFEPRERPWYRAAQASNASVWTPIYVDFRTRELVTTHARRVLDARGEFAGVVATDLSLARVNALLRRLGVNPQGVAMVTEADGALIGVSRGVHLAGAAGANAARLAATDSADTLVAATYAAVRPLAENARDGVPLATAFTGADGQRVQVGYARIADGAGLDWLVIVAVPRHEFLSGIERSVGQTAASTALAAALALGIGLAVLAVVRRELRHLGDATQRLAEGQPGPPLRTDRRDELGDLARRFDDMRTRLLTDPLTGLSNREALLRRADERIRQHRRRDDLQPFALLFADFNRFKQINDRFGHDVGDAVLRELAQRLRTGVRTTDLVARWAGDEFVLLVESANSRPDAEAVRAHLEAELRRPLDALAGVDGETVSAGAAIGIALYPDDGPDVQALLKRADEDMYRRKETR